MNRSGKVSSNAISPSQILHNLIKDLVIHSLSSSSSSKQYNEINTNTSPSTNTSSTTTSTTINSKTKRNIFLLDGGTGEELIAQNVPYNNKAITTNTYGIVPGVGFTKNEIQKYCTIAGQIARHVVVDYTNSIPFHHMFDKTTPTTTSTETATTDDTTSSHDNNDSDTLPIFVLGSLGPLIESYRSDNILERDEGIEYYTLIMQSLQSYVDAYIAETLSTSEEAMQVLQALTNCCCSQSSEVHQGNNNQSYMENNLLLISFTVNNDGKLRSNENVSTAISNVLNYYETFCSPHIHLLGILFNCSEPEAITKAIQYIQNDITLMQRLQSLQIALGAYANRLIPICSPINQNNSNSNITNIKNNDGDDSNQSNNDDNNGTAQPLRIDLSPEQYYTDFVHDWVYKYNLQMIGGCCGISPQHIDYIHQQLKGGRQERINWLPYLKK